MYMDFPLAEFTKNDGILSLMHCEEQNSVSFIKMEFSESSLKWCTIISWVEVDGPWTMVVKLYGSIVWERN